MNDLRLEHLSDLGLLFDSVLSTNTIAKRSLFSYDLKQKLSSRRSSHTNSWLLSSKNSKEFLEVLPRTNNKRSMSKHDSLATFSENITVIDVFNDSNDSVENTTKDDLSIRDSDIEDKHIFLIKKIENNKQLLSLLSIGFRFAEPVFISKTMGQKLKIPPEYMHNYFRDMQLMLETVNAIYTSNPQLTYSPMYKSISEKNIENSHSGVFIGLFALVDEKSSISQIPYIVTNKDKRNTFPLVQLTLGEEKGSINKITELTREQKNIVLNLSGHTLASISSITSSMSWWAEPGTSNNADLTESQPSTEELNRRSPTPPSGTPQDDNICVKDSSQPFMRALESAAIDLISISNYGKHLALSATLSGDIIDIPAFSLRSGPCQLILFRAHITTPGTHIAINQTPTETLKCIPFPIFKAFSYHVTDVAVERYKTDQNRHRQSSTYLTQKLLYQSTHAGSTSNEAYELEVPRRNSSHKQQADGILSLPPPPRAKRNKLSITSAVSGLDITNTMNKGILPNIIKGTTPITLGSGSPFSNLVDQPVDLNILPVKGRFWWLDSLYEETYTNM